MGKAEKELRQGEEALRNFNTDKKYFIKFTESEVLAKALVEMQAMHAKAEVEKEVMLQFRNKRSPQVQQLSLGNQALERQINNYSNLLQNRSNQVGTLTLKKNSLTKELKSTRKSINNCGFNLNSKTLRLPKTRPIPSH